MIVSGTGHRPERLGGYSEQVLEKLTHLAQKTLVDLNPDWIITGMALGWDTAIAQAAVNLGIPFSAAVPFAGQESKWPKQSQIKYADLMNLANKVVIVCEGGYAGWKMQKRNEWMVDKSDLVLALWDGSSNGGTFNCIEYIAKQQKQVVNLWPEWEATTQRGE